MRATLYVDHVEDDSADFEVVDAWLQRWGPAVRVANYSSGGWEHCWDVDAPREALHQLPERFFCASTWADYQGDPDHDVTPPSPKGSQYAADAHDAEKDQEP